MSQPMPCGYEAGDCSGNCAGCGNNPELALEEIRQVLEETLEIVQKGKECPAT